MPDTDGITLLREWSDNGDLGCPVVIMSGHGTVDTAVEATRLGAHDFVEKPLSLAKLLRTKGCPAVACCLRFWRQSVAAL
jgi:DNA-binding NtrC family response regulator